MEERKCECDGSGHIRSEKTKAVRMCQCEIDRIKDAKIEKLKLHIPPMVAKDLIEPIKFIRDEQKIAYESIKPGTWLHGPTRRGKTLLVAKKAIELIRNNDIKYTVKWFEAEDFDLLFQQRYLDKESFREYRKEREEISNTDCVIINDIDKIKLGQNCKLSNNKASELWSLFDFYLSRVKYLIITGNINIASFCDLIEYSVLKETLFSRLYVDLAKNEIKI